MTTRQKMLLRIALASVLLLIFIVLVRAHALSDRQWHWVALGTFVALFADTVVAARRAGSSASWVTKILPPLSAGLAAVYQVLILIN
ncbi:hypothetical protein Q0M94_07430 [Deinococcus radiomollis]|uniref:hypothetical protein n=1 Tax=Deinococcus radiomollis TaxID=468916 RepID=UPI003892560E